MFKLKLHKYIWLIIAIGAIVYLNSIFNGFVWDDEEQILNNVAVHSVANIPSFFFGSTFNTGGTGALGGVYYRPVMMIFFTLLYGLVGPHAMLFHLIQVILHITIAAMLFYFFIKFFKHTTALFLSLIFLVHPMNVEAVSYIAAIQDVMLVFFSMLAFFVGMNIWKDHRVQQAFLVGGFFLLALLSKEVAILSMIIFIVYQALYNRRRVSLYLLIMFIAANVYGFMRFALAHVFFSAFHLAPIVQLSFTERLLMSPVIFLHYIYTFIWPSKLAVMQHWVLKDMSAMSVVVPLFIILVLFAGLIYLMVKTRNKVLIFFCAWFVISISPYLQLFPLDMTVAERWFYFPMIGLLGICGILGERFLYRIWILKRSISVIIAIVIIGSLSVRTIIRNTNWADEITLFGHDIHISTTAFDLENNYGVALFRKQKYDSAIVHFRRSTEFAPTWWVNWNNLGAAYERKGDMKMAVGYYHKSLERGDYYLAYENYTGTLITLGKYTEARTFLEQKALRIFPYNKMLQQYYKYVIQHPQDTSPVRNAL